tara:strand:+ start:1259 stop:1510 length:252 start_codon:yes stop_codon:yes gene_type:complete
VKETIGFIIDILRVNNGIIITLFRFIKLGLIKDNQGFGTFYTLMLAIYNLETSVSIAWRTKQHGNEENTTKNQQKSKTPVASA